VKSQHTLKHRLAGALMIALAAAGCASGTKPQTATDANISINGNVKYGTFARESLAALNPQTSLTRLYVAGNNVLGYTQNNTIYSLSNGLEIRYIEQLAADDVNVLKPIAYGEDIIFPMSTSLKVLDPNGQTVRTIHLPHPLTSEVRLDQRGLLLAGTIAPSGGRVSVIDPQLTVRPIVADTLIGSVFSAPVGYQGIIYAATDAGSVYAIGPENRTAWPLDNMSFATNRSVKADLVIDEYALFVASSDTKLYALDRATGQIKWRYMAEVPLAQSPLVTADRVYQVVGNKGLVAIDKIDGKLYREPLWTTPGITKVLATDADYVYAVEGNNKLVAIGIKDGQVKFDASGDFSMFAADTNGRIYAANDKGVIATFVRKPYTGESTASTK
jgi:outer membrane protein assembly factor BamB